MRELRHSFVFLGVLFLAVITGILGIFILSDFPSDPLYLWPEKPLVVPDRERVQDQRVCLVDNPTITPFLPSADVANGAAVLIFPGGGFARLSFNHEGLDIARWFSGRGVAAFVVKYRLREYGFPFPLLDGARAIRFVRKNAQLWGIDPDNIGVVGFSAGGYVAASLAVEAGFAVREDEHFSGVSARPNFAILGYSLMTHEGLNAHAGSRKALFGGVPELQLLQDTSLLHQVGSNVPPVFVFHGVEDHAVPVGNSLVFFAEVQKYNKRSELHIYQTNVHGVGMIQGQGSISSWSKALELWMIQNQFMSSNSMA